jgi:mevalonate kinase
MKNLLILTLLSVFLNADSNKPMSKEEFLKQMKELDAKEEKAKTNIEKTDKFIQRLEEMKKKLEAEKLESEQKENKK